MSRVTVEALEVRTLFAVPGSFDTSFSGDGRATLDFSSRDDNALDVLTQPDGKVVMAGYSNKSNGLPDIDLFLARYNTNGTLDNSFSGDGKQYVYVPHQGRINAIARQADGKIIAVGYSTQNVDEPGAFVARFTTAGELDKSFAGDGFEWFNYSSKVLEFSDVVIQPNGKIIAVGDSFGSMVVARFNTNGTPDNSFDGDGKRFIKVGDEDTYGLSIALQGDGKIVLAGTTDDVYSSLDIFAMRLKSNGTTDTPFGGNGTGIFRKDYNGGTDWTGSLVLHTGKIYLGGFINWGQNRAVWRLTEDGKLDNTFSGDGAWIGEKGSIEDIVVQNTGKVVYVTDRFNLGRLNANGAGTDLAFTTPVLGLGATAKWGWGLAKYGEEKVVAAGTVEFGQGKYDAGIARYHVGSVPDAPAFNFIKAYDHRTIQIKWTDNSANEAWFTLQRSTDPTFATGVVTYTYNPNIQSASIGNLTPGIRYYFRIRANNSTGNSAWSAPIQMKTPDLPYTVRVNAGGGSYTDFLGRSYTPDAGFTGSSGIDDEAVSIGNTTDDALYYTRRVGKQFGFSQATPDGNYTLVLSFFDPDNTQTGKRVFDVSVEDQILLNDLDLVASAGAKKAKDYVFNITVTDGKFDLKLKASVGNATISAIALIPQF